jgi:hypothetical protein
MHGAAAAAPQTLSLHFGPAAAAGNTPGTQQGAAAHAEGGGAAMVFSATAAWLSQGVAEEPPAGLVDEWDVGEWVGEAVAPVFGAFLDTLDEARSRADALLVARALLWEYYRFRRALALAALSAPPEGARAAAMQAVLDRPSVPQHSEAWMRQKHEWLSASNLGAARGTPGRRRALVRAMALPLDVAIATGALQVAQRTVFVSAGGALPARAWGWRFEPVIRGLYAHTLAAHADGAPARIADAGRIAHPSMDRCGASPDGLVMSGPRAGRLLEIKAPVSRVLVDAVPTDYFDQMQQQAEVCGAPAVDFVEARLRSWTEEAVADALAQPDGGAAALQARAAGAGAAVDAYTPPRVVGAVLVVPCAGAEGGLQYVYSPAFPRDSADGWRAALTWEPARPDGAEAHVVERALWTPEAWHVTTVLRNPRWWAAEGVPAHRQHFEAVDAIRADAALLAEVVAEARAKAEERAARVAAARSGGFDCFDCEAEDGGDGDWAPPVAAAGRPKRARADDGGDGSSDDDDDVEP